LHSILLTHHHADHVGGVDALREATGAQVIGPALDPVPPCDQSVQGGERLCIPELDLDLQVLAVPGHTRGHVAYSGRAAGQEAVLFCGDTLFSLGCGRVFEGTPAQMLASLDALALLPADTQVYCAHEYTASNLRWALAVDPLNPRLLERARVVNEQRAAGLPTVPCRLGDECRENPFLRSRDPAIRAAAERWAGRWLPDASQVFAALREWKNGFR
jgi:hydroxyacylglutathione hydrolase